MPLNADQINRAFNRFIQLRKSNHRYASFDYCYNYFNSFSNKSELAASENLEKSCLHLGFYLASWGMMRASSFLLQENLRFYIPIIKWLADYCPENIWNIDVDNYSNENVEVLISTYNSLSQFVSDKNQKIILVTKIMLGVFGSTPAFDNNFTATFRDDYGETARYRSFNSNSLNAIKNFYDENSNLIEELRQTCRTYNFITAEETNIIYTRAKIIDMIGFGHQIK